MGRKYAKTPDEVEPLRDLVKLGRLFDVQDWLKTDKPVYQPDTKRYSALQLAAREGFHSMVQVLAPENWDQEALDKALRDGVSACNPGIVEILLDRGADPNAVHLHSAAETYNGEIMKLLLDAGIDVHEEDHLAQAISVGAKPQMRIIREYIEAHPDARRQATKALLWAIKDKDARVISFAMWMGADPRMKVGEDPYDEDEYGWTPIDRAIFDEDLEILRKFKPNAEQDDLSSLLCEAVPCLDIMTYLIKKGAPVNNKANGGSSALQKALGWSSGRSDVIELLIEQGARLEPDESYDYRMIRDGFMKRSTNEAYYILYQLSETTRPEVLAKIIDAPRIRKKHGFTPKKTLARMGISLEG